MNANERAVRVGAVKKTKHGGYGRSLGSVVVVVAREGFWESKAHDAALPLLRAALPGLRITTEILDADTCPAPCPGCEDHDGPEA